MKIVLNFDATVRHEELGGRAYTVVPMVPLVEGVHAGSKGPLLYNEEIVGGDPDRWNHMPITMGHPQDEDGDFTSGRSPEMLNQYGVGLVLNAKKGSFVDSKGRTLTRLSAEAWLDDLLIEKHPQGGIVANAIETKTPLELSTGLMPEVDPTKGVWNDEPYDGIITNFNADHLAILVDTEGACSVKDGAGLLVNETTEEIIANEASFNAIHMNAETALEERYGRYNSYVVDVFQSFVVFYYEGKYWKLTYTATDTKVSFTGEPVEVVRFVQYRTPEGDVVVNVQRGAQSMNKKKIVNDLIANSGGAWTEDDREYLMAKSDDALKVIANKFGQKDEETDSDGTEDSTEPKDVTANQSAPAPAPAPKPTTADTLAKLKESDPKAARVLANAVRLYDKHRSGQVEVVLANEKNTLTKAQLEALDDDTLTVLANMAKQDADDQAPMYEGLGDLADALGGKITANRGGTDEVLASPGSPFAKAS